MEDEEIIELFWSRDEEAVTSVQAGYGKMCAQVAGNILKDEEDVRECLNDVWLALWNRIPPERPRILPRLYSAGCEESRAEEVSL